MLSDAELLAVWRAAEEIGYPFGKYVQLLIATGQRRSEVANIKWEQLSDDLASWSQPGLSNKAKRPHLVPLNSIAREVIESIRFSDAGLLFPASSGEGAISGFTKRTNELRRLANVDGWTLHDLRRTMRTNLSKLGIPRYVAELVVNHRQAKSLTEVYDLHDFESEKREAMDRWSVKLETLIGDGEPWL